MNEEVTRKVVMHHLTAFGNNDLIELWADTFLLEADKIRFHTVADYRVKQNEQ